jgi:hypothetical protein
LYIRDPQQFVETSLIEAEGKGKPSLRKKQKKITLTANPTEPINQLGLTSLGGNSPNQACLPAKPSQA